MLLETFCFVAKVRTTRDLTDFDMIQNREQYVT